MGSLMHFLKFVWLFFLNLIAPTRKEYRKNERKSFFASFIHLSGFFVFLLFFIGGCSLYMAFASFWRNIVHAPVAGGG